jgi:hypothetical protein
MPDHGHDLRFGIFPSPDAAAAERSLELALSDLNARIDDRAEANGRGPQAIRRMYNVFGRFGTGSGFLQGGVLDWAEQLAGLAIDEGISTFILGTDSRDDLRRSAVEVVPAVREQVEAERGLRSGNADADAVGPSRPGDHGGLDTPLLDRR